MLELRTLGTTGVRTEGEDGQSVPLEPKRLGLLVYLGTAFSGRAVPRDALLTVFWPELPESDARSALRQAVHYLGKRLGREVLLGVGTGTLGLASDRIRCDALRFDEAIHNNEHARAMRLFRGPFLAGSLHANASAEYLDWVERERSRLAEMAFEAATWLAGAEERRANVTGQIHWLRRALEIEPFREDILGRIVDLHERAGNRGTAAQTIRAFGRIQRSTYGVPLSPAMRQRLRGLQGEIAPPAEDAHQRIHALQAKVAAEIQRTADLVRELQRQRADVD